MKFEAARSSYLDQLRIERGLSSNSISSYGRDLQKFEFFLQANKRDFERLTPQDLTDFEVSLKSLGLALSSINRTLSAVKGFYKYASLEFDIANPTLEIVSAKIARKLPKALSVDQAQHRAAAGGQHRAVGQQHIHIIAQFDVLLVGVVLREDGRVTALTGLQEAARDQIVLPRFLIRFRIDAE